MTTLNRIARRFSEWVALCALRRAHPDFFQAEQAQGEEYVLLRVLKARVSSVHDLFPKVADSGNQALSLPSLEPIQLAYRRKLKRLRAVSPTAL